MKIVILGMALATLGLTGCMTTDEDPYPDIKAVDVIAVSGCKHIGSLSSSSKNFGLFSGTANDTRLQLIKKEAYKIKATHIVLDAPVEDGNTTVTTAGAYVCP